MPQLSVQERHDDVDGVLAHVGAGESSTIARDGVGVAELAPFATEERGGE